MHWVDAEAVTEIDNESGLACVNNGGSLTMVTSGGTKIYVVQEVPNGSMSYSWATIGTFTWYVDTTIDVRIQPILT
jgi:hypothetical protein